MGLTTWAAFSGSEGRPEELATGMRSALDARAAVGKKGKY
jgi:hypothetical protein